MLAGYGTKVLVLIVRFLVSILHRLKSVFHLLHGMDFIMHNIRTVEIPNKKLETCVEYHDKIINCNLDDLN